MTATSVEDVLRLLDAVDRLVAGLQRRDEEGCSNDFEIWEKQFKKYHEKDCQCQICSLKRLADKVRDSLREY